VGRSKNRTVIDRTFGKISVETIFHRSIVGQIPKVLRNMYHNNPLGKYFNIELKSIVWQHDNLAAKGIFGVRVPL